MAAHLPELCGVEPFAIDQTASVEFSRDHVPAGAAWVTQFADELAARGGTAGFLADEAPADWPFRDLADTYLLSTAHRRARWGVRTPHRLDFSPWA